MSALVHRIQTQSWASQDRGTVVAIEEGRDVVVHAEAGRVRARQAVSCLVTPEVDDEVLLATFPSGEVYVLAILERPDGTATRVSAPGDVTFQVAHGAFTVAASEGVRIVSSDDLELTSTKSLKVRAPEGQVFFNKLLYLGERVVAEVAQAKTVVGAVESVADRVVERVKRAYRFVEELDQLRAEYIDYAATKNVRLRGHNALVTAEQLFKVDADQIHLG